MRRLATGLFAAAVGLALVAAPRPVHAQGLTLGVEGGATFSDINVGDNSLNFSNRTGYRIAGIVRYDFGPLFGIESGVSLTQKGGTLPPSESGLSNDLSFNLTYVEIPAMLTLRIPTGPAPVTPRFFAGPTLGFESTCDVSTTVQGISGTVDCAAQALGGGGFDTKSTTLGLEFGGGLDIALGGPFAMTVDGRYGLGLTDINNSTTQTNPTSIKNRYFAVSGGLLFRLP